MLLSVTLRFDEGVVTMDLQGADARVEVHAEKVLRLVCPQEHPWGASSDVYVNEARYAETPNGASLEIETQNGDVIVVQASRISVRVNGGGPPVDVRV
ncbi:MAG: hypothetical protein R2712_03040 [Vicinamibacterales bacterium]